MKLITRDTDYAIRVICAIAKNERRTVSSAKDLVGQLEMPRPFLRKILQKLNKSGILKSYKGRGGGFILTRIPEKIFVGDLIKIFQGPLKLQEHVFRKRPCPRVKRCLLKKKIDVIEKYVIGKLASIKLSSLIMKND